MRRGTKVTLQFQALVYIVSHLDYLECQSNSQLASKMLRTLCSQIKNVFKNPKVKKCIDY